MTPRQWRSYQEAMQVSLAQWERLAFERGETPDVNVTIRGRDPDDWEPTITWDD